MTLNTLLERCADLDVMETRNATDDCRIFVVRNEILGEWSSSLTSLLGEPIKPAGMAPRKEHLEITKDLGSIYSDQTLFAKDFDPGTTIIAMFWPWQHEPLTTIKLHLVPASRSLPH